MNRFRWSWLCALSLHCGTAAAAELSVTVELPTLKVAEYHRPYVAIWLEDEQQQTAAQLALWYQTGKGGDEGEGTKWLKDLRTWWRRGGRALQLPVDGLSSATRAPGSHELHYRSKDGALAGLAPGPYRLQVEAAREVGGRELLSLPLHWPPPAVATLRTRGAHELGQLIVQLAP